jgi:hypothetical protein
VAAEPGYSTFWERLGRGELISGEFRRVSKEGRNVYLQTDYSPIFDQDGKPFKIVKYATDITASRLRSADRITQFPPWLSARGELIGEVLLDDTGQHHIILVVEALRRDATPDYAGLLRNINHRGRTIPVYCAAMRLGRGPCPP